MSQHNATLSINAADWDDSELINAYESSIQSYIKQHKTNKKQPDGKQAIATTSANKTHIGASLPLTTVPTTTTDVATAATKKRRRTRSKCDSTSSTTANSRRKSTTTGNTNATFKNDNNNNSNSNKRRKTMPLTNNSDNTTQNNAKNTSTPIGIAQERNNNEPSFPTWTTVVEPQSSNNTTTATTTPHKASSNTTVAPPANAFNATIPNYNNYNHAHNPPVQQLHHPLCPQSQRVVSNFQAMPITPAVVQGSSMPPIPPNTPSEIANMLFMFYYAGYFAGMANK